MSGAFFPASERLLSAAANGLYQGLLVALVTGLALRLFSRTNAATRHAIWFAVLLFVAALIPAHLLLSLLSGAPAPAPAAAVFAKPPVFAPAPSSENSSEGTMADSNVTAGQGNEAEAEPVATAAVAETQAETVVTAEPSAVAQKIWPTFSPAIPRPLARAITTDIHLPHLVCLGLVGAWILLAGIRSGWLIWRLREVRRVKATSQIPSQNLQLLFEKLRLALAARRRPQLRVSCVHRAAGALGFFHPVILLPAEMDDDASTGDVEHVLRHELAHVERRDDWVNLSQQIIQAALFFHPAVWWISGKLSLEREIACDDHVLEASGRPKTYALTLANVAMRFNHASHLLAPGVSDSNSQLQQRITMILNTKRDRSPRLARRRLGLFTTATAILAVIAINCAPRLVLGQSAAPASAAGPSVSPVAPSADGTPAALPPDSSETSSGPRFKEGDTTATSAPVASNYLPAPPAPPTPTSSSVAPVPPAPSAVMVSPMGIDGTQVGMVALAGPVPVSPGAGLPPEPGHKNMSVEERLDRIERILEDLQAHNKGRHRTEVFSTTQVQPATAQAAPAHPSGDRTWDERAAEQADRAAEEVRRAVEASQRAAEAGQRAAEAGQRAAEQAMRDVERLKNKNFDKFQQDLHATEGEASMKELQALRQVHESLQSQVKSIERQIQRLEQDRNRGQKADGRKTDQLKDADEAAKPELPDLPEPLKQ